MYKVGFFFCTPNRAGKIVALFAGAIAHYWLCFSVCFFSPQFIVFLAKCLLFLFLNDWHALSSSANCTLTDIEGRLSTRYVSYVAHCLFDVSQSIYSYFNMSQRANIAGLSVLLICPVGTAPGVRRACMCLCTGNGTHALKAIVATCSVNHKRSSSLPEQT